MCILVIDLVSQWIIISFFHINIYYYTFFILYLYILYVFLDIGTYAEAWNKDHSTGRFLYTAGLQVSLFKDILTVSAPLLMSKDFRNTLKTDPEENKFFKKITFSISFKQLSPRMVHPQIPL